jgi:hypothetical protein
MVWKIKVFPLLRRRNAKYYLVNSGKMRQVFKPDFKTNVWYFFVVIAEFLCKSKKLIMKPSVLR